MAAVPLSWLSFCFMSVWQTASVTSETTTASAMTRAAGMPH